MILRLNHHLHHIVKNQSVSEGSSIYKISSDQEMNYVLANLDSNPSLVTNWMYDLGNLNSPLCISVLLFCKKKKWGVI